RLHQQAPGHVEAIARPDRWPKGPDPWPPARKALLRARFAQSARTARRTAVSELAALDGRWRGLVFWPWLEFWPNEFQKARARPFRHLPRLRADRVRRARKLAPSLRRGRRYAHVAIRS